MPQPDDLEIALDFTAAVDVSARADALCRLPDHAALFGTLAEVWCELA
jgi:hypothetical protein